MKKFYTQNDCIKYQGEGKYSEFSKNVFTLKYIYYTYFQSHPTHKNKKIIQFFLHHKKNNSI